MSKCSIIIARQLMELSSIIVWYHSISHRAMNSNLTKYTYKQIPLYQGLIIYYKTLDSMNVELSMSTLQVYNYTYWQTSDGEFIEIILIIQACYKFKQCSIWFKKGLQLVIQLLLQLLSKTPAWATVKTKYIRQEMWKKLMEILEGVNYIK